MIKGAPNCHTIGQTFEATPEDLEIMDKVEGVSSGLYRRVEEQGVLFYLEWFRIPSSQVKRGLGKSR